ncbi:MAG: AAA family ATPase [Oleiphilus sp.]
MNTVSPLIQPPQSIQEKRVLEDERTVLGNILYNQELLKQCSLESLHFTGPEHKDIYSAIKKLKAADADINPLSACELLEQANRLREDGVEYVAKLAITYQSGGKLFESACKSVFDYGLLQAANKVISESKSFEEFDQRYEKLKSFKSNLDSRNFNFQSYGHNFLDQINSIPQRLYSIEGILLDGYVNAIFSPGGVGKSTFQLLLAISVAAGKDLLGLGRVRQGKVLLINNEDDQYEILRRIGGICIQYGIKSVDNLETISGYGNPVLFARESSGGEIILCPQMEALSEHIKKENIKALMIDPFISTHDSDENANDKIDKVISKYKQVAQQTGCAIHICHHTKKLGGDSETHAGDAEAGRGASSLKDAARCCHTLARMNSKTAQKAGIDSSERVRYIRLDSAKCNFSLPDADARWFKINSVQLPNGDFVGVPVPVNLQPLFGKSSNDDARVKWTPSSVAESLHKVFPYGRNSVPFNEMIIQFQDQNEIAERMAKKLATTIPGDKNHAIKILVAGKYWSYWHSKENKTAPVIINRVEH